MIHNYIQCNLINIPIDENSICNGTSSSIIDLIKTSTNFENRVKTNTYLSKNSLRNNYYKVIERIRKKLTEKNFRFFLNCKFNPNKHNYYQLFCNIL